MRLKKQISVWALFGLFFTLFQCTYDYKYIEPPPEPPKATQDLEASYVDKPSLSLNDPYWNNADYREVALKDINTGELYPEGYLNMTGTYNGTGDFDPGKMTMKAAYNDQKIFILMEWSDEELNLSTASWLWNGPKDPRKQDSTQAWTSQRNSDKVALAFELARASSSAGSFTNIGCEAACHSQGGKKLMQPRQGKVDIWKWDPAYTQPLGYAADMVSGSNSGLVKDTGDRMRHRNSKGNTSRSGPSYVWNGESQNYTSPGGNATILDPAYYILNEKKIPFKGDAEKGDEVYQKNCSNCHGKTGNGQGQGGYVTPAFNKPGTNRFSRQAFIDFTGSGSHTGNNYFNSLNDSQVTNLIARIRGFSGVPSYYLTKPSGSYADIHANSNVKLVKAERTEDQYRVLLTRKLVTGNPDDIQFEKTKDHSYPFGIAVMDNDGKNHIGSKLEKLVLKARKVQ